MDKRNDHGHFFGESLWHREWKAAFPEVLREQTFFDPVQNCYHRADIFSRCGTAIEFQRSPLALSELKQRESYYQKLVWVLDATKFKGFKILKHLPEFSHPRLRDYEVAQGANLILYRKQDILQNLSKPKRLALSHPELAGLPMSADLFSFSWKHPHQVWYQAKFPLYFDFGGYFLYQLKHRAQTNSIYSYLQLLPKKDFIKRWDEV